MSLYRKLYHAMLAVPLVLAVAWVATLSAPVGPGLALSPARTESLITGLTVFIIGYIIFLGLIYSEELKKLVVRLKYQ